METEKKTFFEETKELAANYVEDKLLLIKLQAADQASRISSSIVKILLVATMLFFIMMIVTFLAGYYLSQWTGSFIAGFGILIALYILILMLLLYTHKKYMNKYIIDKVIQMFFNNKED